MQKKLNKKLDLNEELSYLPKSTVLTKENNGLSSASSFSQLYLVILHWLRSKLRSTDIYLPFAYLEKVKRKGEKYTLKIIFCDDIPILLLAFSWGNSNFFFHGASLIFLLISFWCIYELGYYENDCIAEKYEEKPKLSSTYHAYKQMMNTSYPWLWSLVFGWIGIVLLEQTQGIYLPFKNLLLEQKTNSLEPIILFFLSWILFLVCVKYCFSIYNYFNKQTRTWLYFALQSIRYYGLLWVTGSSLIGVSFLSSQILSRSLLYIVYRYSGGNSVNWPGEIPEQLLRCSIFVFMLITICFGSQSLEVWQSGQTWVILAWCIVRGRSQIKKVLAQVKLVSQDGSN